MKDIAQEERVLDRWMVLCVGRCDKGSRLVVVSGGVQRNGMAVWMVLDKRKCEQSFKGKTGGGQDRLLKEIIWLCHGGFSFVREQGHAEEKYGMKCYISVAYLGM